MVWLAIFVGAVIIELLSLTFFTLWFGLGAIVAYGLSFLGMPLWGQIVTFLAISLISLKLFRQFALGSYKHKTNVNDLIGKEAVVSGKNSNGFLVRVRGIEWAVQQQSEEDFKINEKVLIRGVQGVKLLIERKGGQK